jgi:phage minor structural protein
MIPILYPATETAFTNNGLGGLPDAISCVVTEQRNTPGGYWLEMDYPTNGLHYADIIQDRIIYAAPAMRKTPQPFRIRRISRPIDGVVHIEAPHVSAELQKLTSYGIDTGTNIQGMIYNQFYRARQLGQTVPFWCETDITTETDITFSHPEPTTLMDILLGTEGSVLDLVGGEFEWDGYHIILHRQRGVDSGIEIRYGVNMTDMNAETDAAELVTAVIPYWHGQISGAETVVIGSMCYAPNASAFAYVRCVPLDVSDQFQLEQDQQPTAAQVTAAGQAFISSTSQSELVMSIDVQYTPITTVDRPVNLCDTVHVVHPDLRVSSTAKVVETTYNTLTERYDGLTIGSIKQTIVDTVAKMIGGR